MLARSHETYFLTGVGRAFSACRGSGGYKGLACRFLLFLASRYYYWHLGIGAISQPRQFLLRFLQLNNSQICCLVVIMVCEYSRIYCSQYLLTLIDLLGTKQKAPAA